MKTVYIYRVYEISNKFPKGRKLKDFHTFDVMIKYLNKSIYRYYKKIMVLDYT